MLKSYSVIQSVNPYFRLSKQTSTFLILLILASCNGEDNDGDPPFGDPSPSISCPDGFIPVPHNTEVGTTSDFCVMKYEAKNNGSGVAVSQASGNPYVNLTIGESQTKCTDLGANYDLISNPEWMTIARNVESVSSNWSTGTVGTGVMARGWTNEWNSAVAPFADSSCLYNTGANSCGSSGSHLYKRTLTLSNGEEIWDLSGNVSEWVDWSLDWGLQEGPKTCIGDSWVDFSVVASDPCYINGALFSHQVFPATSNGSSMEVFGRFLGGYGGATVRGGAWHFEAFAGAFTLDLTFSTGYTDSSYGFRCVYRP